MSAHPMLAREQVRHMWEIRLILIAHEDVTPHLEVLDATSEATGPRPVVRVANAPVGLRPHARSALAGRGGDRPAGRLAVSGRSSRGPYGNGVTRKVA